MVQLCYHSSTLLSWFNSVIMVQLCYYHSSTLLSSRFNSVIITVQLRYHHGSSLLASWAMSLSQVDPFHTLFGLAGLSLLGDSSVQPVNPVYCMPESIIRRLKLSMSDVADNSWWVIVSVYRLCLWRFWARSGLEQTFCWRRALRGHVLVGLTGDGCSFSEVKTYWQDDQIYSG